MNLRTALFAAAIVALVGSADGLPAADKKKDKDRGGPTGPIDPVGEPPQFTKAKGRIIALWYDDGWWHLRASGPKNEKAVFTGTVTCDKGQVAIKQQAAEKKKIAKKADYIDPNGDGSGFEFRFFNTGASDGVDFKSRAADGKFTFKLLVGGGEQPDNVFIGKKGANPEKIPFTLPAVPAE